MKNKIDFKRFMNGQKQFRVEGVASSENRKNLVGEAIGLIQKNPIVALKNGYLGYKNYEGFGDQRCDCSYGMGPRHGSIVFSVGRSGSYDENGNHEDKIYFLKCFRDSIGLSRKVDYHRNTIDNIQEVYCRMVKLEEESAKLQDFLDSLEVDEDDSEVVPC